MSWLLNFVYLIVLATKLSSLVAATYLNADSASAPVIGALYGGSAAHREVVLGQMAWFATLIFELATRWLPLHREIWEGAPYAMALASAAMIAWGAWRVAGRWAALIAAVLALCAGPQTLLLLFSLNDHASTWFSIALLGALLILFESPPAALGRVALVLIALLAGVIVGINAASDLLLLPGGVVPVLLAAGGALALRPARPAALAAAWTAATMVVVLVSDLVTRSVMHGAGVAASSGLAHTTLASTAALPSNFKLWWQSLMVLGDGNFFGLSLGFTSALELACALLWVAGLAAGTRWAWREIVQRRDADPARLAWCIFWASSGLLLSAAFIFSSNPIDLGSSRYLTGVLYAGAALIPLAAGGRRAARFAVTAGVSVFCFTGIVGLVEDQSIGGTGATYSLYNQVARLAALNHLDFGYAAYWDAAPIAWATHLRLHVYPVQDCYPTPSPVLCWTPVHTITSWYVPRRGKHSFMIADSGTAMPTVVGANLGTPTHTYQIGSMTMYVYPYDIASKMIP